MPLLDNLRRFFVREPEAESAFDPERFVYVKLPRSIGPLERGSKYEDAIQARLMDHGVGCVTGGGSQLGDLRPDGTRGIDFSGIDVEVDNLERALHLLRRELLVLHAPDGTELHYTRNDVRLQDELRGRTWRLAKSRHFRHPGFGC